MTKKEVKNEENIEAEDETALCVKFIHDNIIPIPKKERKTAWTFPLDVAQTIYRRIIDLNENVAIPREGFNLQFGWKPETSRNRYLTRKLNDLDMIVATWHVGTRNNKEFYTFSLVE